MKVALVHDWLVTYRGGEKVLEQLAALFPSAPIYTLFYDPKKLPLSLTQREIIFPKNLNRFVGMRKEFLLAFYPSIIESFDLTAYDLIISSSSCVAKGIIPGPQAKHLCYLHAPMRYIWDQQKFYFSTYGKIPGLSFIANLLATQLRMWDVTSSARVDQFVANSHFVAQRIQRYYRRDSTVIPPPVQLPTQSPQWKKKAYYLVAGAWVPYKRLEIAVEACKIMNKNLIVAGFGSEEAKLRAAAGPLTQFIQSPDDATLHRLLGEAQALLFPGIEDFGILPVEAMAQGTPVIAIKKGGALDYIEEGKTGLFFSEQTVSSLQEAMMKFETLQFTPETLYTASQQFGETMFIRRIQKEIDTLLGRE